MGITSRVDKARYQKLNLSGGALNSRFVKTRDSNWFRPLVSTNRLSSTPAKQFPDELAARVPPKRRDWTSEYARMDIFDAVGLAIVFLIK